MRFDRHDLIFNLSHTSFFFEKFRSFSKIFGNDQNETKFRALHQKKWEKQSVSQMIDLVMTMKTHTESSKSELSSRGKRPFKVSKYFTDDNYIDDKNISGAEGG